MLNIPEYWKPQWNSLVKKFVTITIKGGNVFEKASNAHQGCLFKQKYS